MCMHGIAQEEQPKKSMRRRKPGFEEVMEHIGELLPEDARRLIARKAKQYIWQYPKARGGAAWCTACGTEFADGVRARHNDVIGCPRCGAAVIYKQAGKGHKSVYDSFYFYDWRRSAIDPEAVTLTATHVWRDSGVECPEGAELHMIPSAVYLFRAGEGGTVYKKSRWRQEGGWGKVNLVAPEHTIMGQGRMEIMVTGLETAIAGTGIGRVLGKLHEHMRTWDNLMLRPVQNAARWPWLEYLAAAGQEKLAGQMIAWESAGKIINPRGKTVREVLRLTEGQWYEVRRDGIELDETTLLKLKLIREAGLDSWKIRDVMALKAGRHGTMAMMEYALDKGKSGWKRGAAWYLRDCGEKLRRKALRRILRELDSAIEWRDYYEMAAELGEDMTNPLIVLPRDMHAMHDRMSERLNIIRAEKRAAEKREKAAKLEGRYAQFREKLLPKWKKEYCFEACGLVLRPYESAAEVIEEGVALSICIGNYAERYLDGGTILCCLRRAEEPDKPWRAVEFSKSSGKLVQDRGYQNDNAYRPGGETTIDEETQALLKEFWEAFENRKERNAA